MGEVSTEPMHGGLTGSENHSPYLN